MARPTSQFADVVVGLVADSEIDYASFELRTWAGAQPMANWGASLILPATLELWIQDSHVDVTFDVRVDGYSQLREWRRRSQAPRGSLAV